MCTLLPHELVGEITIQLAHRASLHDVAAWARTCSAARAAGRIAVAEALDERRRLRAALADLVRATPPDFEMLICDEWSKARRLVGAWIAALDELPPPSSVLRCYHDFDVTRLSGLRRTWRVRVWYVRPGRRRHAIAMATTGWVSSWTSCASTLRHHRRYCLDALRGDVDAAMRLDDLEPVSSVDRLACEALGVVRGTHARWFGAATQRRVATAHRGDSLVAYRDRIERALDECASMHVLLPGRDRARMRQLKKEQKRRDGARK